MISTVDLLVFAGSDKLLLYNKNILLIYKTSYPGAYIIKLLTAVSYDFSQ